MEQVSSMDEDVTPGRHYILALAERHFKMIASTSQRSNPRRNSLVIAADRIASSSILGNGSTFVMRRQRPEHHGTVVASHSKVATRGRSWSTTIHKMVVISS